METKEVMGAKIHDQFASLNVSRGRKWQMRKALLGLCVICGMPAVTNWHCEVHLENGREAGRNRYRRKVGIPLNRPLTGRGRPRLENKSHKTR